MLIKYALLAIVFILLVSILYDGYKQARRRRTEKLHPPDKPEAVDPHAGQDDEPPGKEQ